MIGLDLDGTLLNTKKELTEYTKEILTRAIESGVTILTATGRPYTGIPEELREFPGMRYALTSNGARIIDREKMKDTEEKGVLTEHYKRYILTDRGMRKQTNWRKSNVTITVRICRNM